MSKEKNEPLLRSANVLTEYTSVAYGITVTKVKNGDRTDTKTMLNTIKYNIDKKAVGSVESVEVEDIAYALSKIEIELIKDLRVGE